jgi:(S)-ureidoglycine aminohydrolase
MTMGYPTDLLRSRAVVRRNYALLDPAGLCHSTLPDFPDCTVNVLASPALGATFAQYLVTMPPGAATARTLVEAGVQRFVYGLSGAAEVQVGATTMALGAGSFAYVPPGEGFAMRQTGDAECRFLMVRRPYRPLAGAGAPWAVLGHEDEVPKPSFQGMPTVTLQNLLPAHPAFDLMVNVFTFQPGDSLNIVETHHETHGAYILSGQGMYFLDDTWYPVKAGDFIWMGPFCPQAFYATGQTPARYIYTKEANRDIAF